MRIVNGYALYMERRLVQFQKAQLDIRILSISELDVKQVVDSL
jgi:hypothetical protein